MTFLGHTARKNFGQHWLKDKTILRKILEVAEISPSDIILEIGPGRGALTKYLLASLALFTYAVELDRDLAFMLRKQLGFSSRLALVEADILNIDFLSQGKCRPNKVVANIPYNITGLLLENLLGTLITPAVRPYERIVLLVQKEVGERICAHPGDSNYGALSVRMQLLARCYNICEVRPSCFQPPPSVKSLVLVLKPLPTQDLLIPNLASQVDKLLNLCFSSRRKMLRSTLPKLIDRDCLENLMIETGVDLHQRPQEVSPAAWVKLAMNLNGLPLNS
uniref:rRNA adenine N(6)-methyltransferase n=1 Tax=Paulinella micropora TaxID=1928728 RepID=A0A385HZX7_9EUKA|nr:putative rRNA (adenine-N6,N6)- dimethyltransferase [Paulinella micropora]AXY63188.1 putative rRNA (adenine-N6,N6)- dimethyltransferase [Paulinella micropora]